MKKLFILIILSIILLLGGIAQAKEKSLITQASWYSKNDPTDPFEHKFNADGSKFNENALTCAMRSRDFGKYYRVTNLANGKSTVVKHRDFGPAKEYKGRKLNRDIDLSKKAFESIANLDLGVIKVKVEGVINVAHK